MFPETQALPRATLSSLAPGQVRVQIEGELPIDWASRVTTGIARQGGSILRGHARRHDTGAWEALFEVATTSCFSDDVVEGWLATEATDRSTAPPRIERFSLSDRHDHSPARLVLEARDAVGLLGGCLRAFAMMGVFPVAFEIDTRGEQVNDTFALRSMGDTGLERATRLRLTRLLERMQDG